MAEVDVAEDELAVFFQDFADFKKFDAFLLAHVLKEAQGRYKIEAAIFECDRLLCNV